MPDNSSPKIQAQIPQSFIQFTINFAAPVITLGESRGQVIEKSLAALRPYGFLLEGVETKLGDEKPSEHVMVFRRTRPQVPAASITLGYEKIVVAAEGLDWEGAPRFIETMNAGIGAIRAEVRPTIESQHFILGMHVQIKDKPRAELVRPLVTDDAVRLLDGKADFTGVVINGGKLTVVIESSVVFANSLWVRILRGHDAGTSIEQIAAILRADEERLFEVLNLEGAL